MGGRLQVARCRPALDSFFESIFFEERRQWTVDGDSFLVFIFFEERMGGRRLQGAGCRLALDSFFELIFFEERRIGRWKNGRWKVVGRGCSGSRVYVWALIAVMRSRWTP